MPLSPGASFGPYLIERELGRGGMGIVYGATDPRLGRRVAIKVLPEHLTRDTERLARFEREARTLASINHPNVAGIHGIEEHEGHRCLVLEFVEGEALSERLRRGPVPVTEAVELAARIAAGVEAAHEAGIIHRDLKPGNVMQTPDGAVKVLDFGLAKAIDPASAPDSADSPTLAHATAHSPTIPGAILGTAAYMSPEQARGKSIDKRTDIWAFGVILAEMLTGRPLFAGETATEILASVLRDTPRIDDLPAAVPGAVRRILERCLERDPRRRLRDIGEARIVLETPGDFEGTATQPGAAPAARGGGASWPVAIGLAVALAAIAAVLTSTMRKAPEPPSLRLEIGAPDLRIDWMSTPQLSPDGSRVAYATQGRLWIRALDRLQSVAVAEVSDISPYFWSPRGDFLAYESNGKVWKVAAGGGEPIVVADIPGTGSLVGGAWGPDDAIVLSVWRGGLYRVSGSSGESVLLLSPDPRTQVDFHHPSFLPGGSILFATHWQETADATPGGPSLTVLRDGTSIPVADLDVSDDSSPVYHDGRLWFLRSSPNAGIWAVDFDPRAARVTGDPFLAEPGAASISWAEDGTLLYVEGEGQQAEFELGWLDRSGRWIERVGTPRPHLTEPSFSPDGRRIVYAAGAGAEGSEIWILDPARVRDVRLTFEPGHHVAPRWLDDRRILYVTRTGESRIAPGGRGGVVRLRNGDGSGTPRDLNRDSGSGLGNPFLATTPDPGQYLQVVDAEGRGELRLYGIPEGDGAGPARPALPDAAQLNVREARVSPDGGLLAIVTDVNGQPEVFVTRFPSGDGRWQASFDGGRLPRWEGSTLYFVAGSGPSRRTLVAIEMSSTDDVPLGEKTTLFELAQEDVGRSGFDAGWDIEPGAARFLIARRVRDGGAQSPERLIVMPSWRKS